MISQKSQQKFFFLWPCPLELNGRRNFFFYKKKFLKKFICSLMINPFNGTAIKKITLFCSFSYSVLGSINPGLGITLGPRSLRRGPHTYPYIPLKNRLRAFRKNSVRITYYSNLFATRSEFLRGARSLFFCQIWRYVWGPLLFLYGDCGVSM